MAGSSLAVLRYSDTAKVWAVKQVSCWPAVSCGWRTGIQRGLSRGWGWPGKSECRIRLAAWWRRAWRNGSPFVLIMRQKLEITCKGKLLLSSGLVAEGLDDKFMGLLPLRYE